jgi:hypothetical protein
MKVGIRCIKCSTENFIGEYYFKKKDVQTYLCRSCGSKGDRNNNYGNSWTEEQKKIQSTLVSSKVDDEYRERCGKSMRGKTVAQETIDKQLNTKMERYGTLNFHRGFTEEGLTILGEKSAAKFTPEFKRKRREVMESRGHWLTLDKKDEYLVYRELADWKGDILSEEVVGRELLKTHTIKSKSYNIADSLVRDHMYGRKAGFESGVFPEILRHPANCQLLTNSDNIRKSKVNNDCIITLGELFSRVLSWKSEYEGQLKCLELIEAYKKGLRYNKEDYK